MIYLSCRSLIQMGKKLTSSILLITVLLNEKFSIEIFVIGLSFQIRIQSHEEKTVEEDPVETKWDSESSRNNGPVYRSRSEQKLWIQVMNSCRYTASEIANLKKSNQYGDNAKFLMHILFRWGKVTNQNHLKYNSKGACHDTYIGHQPWTEPEAVAIRDFILNTSSAEFKVTTHYYTHISCYN